MRIALAQTNPTVGDIAGNARIIERLIDQARQTAVQLIVFPELSILGYPPKDLLNKPMVLDQCERALEHIAPHCTGIAALVGIPLLNRARSGRPLYNAAAFCADGKISHYHCKTLLPTYDVFDESRYFEASDQVNLADFHNLKLGISICEDLWNDADFQPRQLYHSDPIAALAQAGASVIINLSASPFVVGKHDFRLKMFSHAAKRHHVSLVYVNQVGGNDELIFDGNSCAISPTGDLVAHARDFQPDLVLIDLPDPADTRQTPVPIKCPARRGIASVYEALVLGLGDYCRKCGFRSIVLGLSGGIDSAVTAAIAVAALGGSNVTGVSMPSRYSSQGSRTDAEKLAENLGMKLHTVPIAPAHQAMECLMQPFFENLPPDATEENMQARLRGIILMGFSNKFGSLLVTTGNKSELAVGYSTLYGDMCGGLAVLGDVPKTMVYELAQYINSDQCILSRDHPAGVIPADTITKPPSAELRPNQTDQDSLPAYDVLDQIVDRYVERDQSPAQIIAETGLDPDTVHKFVSIIDRNEYKRKQAPPVLKITGRSFGTGRRMPIAQRYDATGTALDLLTAGS